MQRWKLFRPAISLPALFLCALVGVLFGLSGFTFWYAEGHSYLSNNPETCINCHVMREHYDGWIKASHHGVAACNDCHLSHDNVAAKYYSKGRNGFFHSWAFTFQNFDEPIRIHAFNKKILQANCVRCHEDLIADIPDHDQLDCTRCHQAVGHGPPR